MKNYDNGPMLQFDSLTINKNNNGLSQICSASNLFISENNLLNQKIPVFGDSQFLGSLEMTLT
jgi:hypothetical protein